ncbi:hypothetical protein [Microbacterium sp. NPDC057650]|uniref:hypothetical protein n=1 Tax=unclassified Microbacterium TaxID=2609290 RepID=UPI00366F2F00
MTKWKAGGGRPATQVEINEAEDLAVIARKQLPIIRQAATNWRNGVGLGSFLALVVPVAIGPETIQVLSAQEKFNVAWLLGIGALLTVVSLALAMFASFGWPTAAKIGTTGGLRSWESSAARSASWCLSVSMLLAVAALFALGSGLAVVVFGVPWPWDFPGWQ